MPTEPNKPADKQNRPGAMTVAMQAVQAKPTGPKVLRIGVIQNGRIVEERVIRKRETVAVGTSEKNHFVVLGDGVPSRFDVFQLVGDDYILNYTEQMSGRIGLPGGVQDLDQMRKNGAARNAGTHYQVKLTDNSRGRVNIGTTTLLFQFVVPPPVQPRPQLPAAARAGFVRSIDWMFTSLTVFTFMTMFGFIVYLENADWPLAQEVAEVPEELARLIFEDPTPPPEVPEEDAEAVEEAEAEAEAPPKKEDPGPPKEAPAPSESEAQAQAEATARIAEEAAQAAEALIVGALSAEGGALADVLAGGAVTGNAQDILAQAAGVGVAQSAAGGTLRQRSGGGTGSGQQGLGSLQRAGGSETTAGRSEGTVVKERTIKGNLKLGDGDAIGGAGEFDANLVIAKIRSRLGGIRACYERELRKNPTLAGKVTIEFAIEERGNISGVKVAENTTGDTAVGECVANEIKRIPTFNPGPEGGKVVFAYPFVFAPQQ